jgi:integrase
MPDTTTAPSQILKELAPGKFTILCKIRPSGSLWARRQANDAIIFYWRYSIGNKSERVAIGQYDTKAPPKALTPTTAGGYSIAAAIRAAEVQAEEHYQHKDKGGRPALLKAERLAQEAANRIQHELALEQQRREKHTLKHLLEDYCDHLESLGRTAHRDARSIFKLHIYDAWSDVTSQPANTVQDEQIADMMRLLIKAKKGRTANKLRSYVRAAFQTAKAARSDASVPAKFKDYQVKHNPASDTVPDHSQNRSAKKPLTATPMRIYWRALKKLPDFKGAVLRLHLLTGGQRIEQLVKLLTENIGKDDAGHPQIKLFDGKGRPGKEPRPHVIPLTPEAYETLKQCQPSGEYALSTDSGQTHLSASTLSGWAMELAGGIEELEDFQTKRIRSGVETVLAAAGISSDIRGRLQSHGISGVQARHYDGHEYMDEKRHALETLHQILQQPINQPVKKA